MGYVLFGIRGLQPTGEGRQCLGVVLGYSNLSEAILKHCKGVVKRYPLPGSLAADLTKLQSGLCQENYLTSVLLPSAIKSAAP